MAASEPRTLISEIRNTKPGDVAQQFDDAEQQHESANLGMWTFLVTEIMFFGGLFACYCAYRFAYPEVFAHMSRHLDFTLGTINTGVLLCSSLTMALAVQAAQHGRRKSLVGFLIVTLLFGTLFMGIKASEYHKEFEEHLVPWLNFANAPGLPPTGEVQIANRALSGATFPHSMPFDRERSAAELFMLLYFFMTGFHALHLTIGICIVSYITVLAWRGRFTPEASTPVELVGLYWHFIDIVWVFIYPLLYLVNRHS